MGKFLDALLNKQTMQPASVSSATTGQPVPVSQIIQAPSALSSAGAAGMTRASSAWPTLVDNSGKLFNSWKANVLQEVQARNIIGNYGSVTSQANFGFEFHAFNSIGLHSGPIPNPYVPEYNNLVPISWGQRVGNPNVPANLVAQKGPITVQTKSSQWLGSSTASLARTGVTLL
jgi:hypothetical protein